MNSQMQSSHLVPLFDRATGHLRLPNDLIDVTQRMSHIESLESEALRAKDTTEPPSTEELKRLGDGKVATEGILDPLAYQIFSTIKNASLVVKVEIEIDVRTSTTDLWATTTRGVRGHSLDSITTDYQPIATERIPQILADLIVLRRPKQMGTAPISISSEILLEAQRKRPVAEAALSILTKGGLSDRQADLILKFHGKNARRWKISTTWSTDDSQEQSELYGVDAGNEGQWLAAKTGSEDRPGQLTYTPISTTEITKGIRKIMPRNWVSRPVELGI